MAIKTHAYYKLYKPFGYVSQFITNDRHAKNKRFLGELFPFPENTMAVGRLDEPSEGLLFLTTDGAFSYRINNAGVEKEYYAQVDGVITDTAIQSLATGVNITVNGKQFTTADCVVQQIDTPSLPQRGKKLRDARHGPTSWIRIIITEGKFRQVRKMTAAVGYPTLRLVRFRIGTETITGMQAGEVQEIIPNI